MFHTHDGSTNPPVSTTGEPDAPPERTLGSFCRPLHVPREVYLALVRQGGWRDLALAALPLLVYQAAFSLAFDKAPFALYFRGTPTASYGHGGWLHYVLPLVRSIGPPVALLAAVGLVVTRRDRRVLLLAAPFVLLVLVETVIFRFGLFGSGGNADYLLPVNADIPEIDVTFLDITDFNISSIGARGLGEITITGVAPAIANAVYHATGIRVRDLPITIESLMA